MKNAIALAVKMGMRSIRLDVYEKNAQQYIYTRSSASGILTRQTWGIGSMDWTGFCYMRSCYKQTVTKGDTYVFG